MSNRQFKVGSFNLFNLVRADWPYYNNKKYSQEEFQKKTDWTGRQLDRMDVDLIGFQEVFHQEALTAALSKSHRFSQVEPIVFGTQESESPACTAVVALASRLTVTHSETIQEFPKDAILTGIGHYPTVSTNTFSRPVLKARIKISDDFELVVFVVHLKSKRPIYLEHESSDNPLHRALGSARALITRAVEAVAIRSLVLDEVKKTSMPVILLGDVNDGSAAVTTQMIEGEKPYYRWRKDKKKPYWDVLLYAAQEIQALESTRDVYFTHIYNGHYEALDHILFSQEFYDRNPARKAEVIYVRVLNDHIIDEVQAFDEVPPTQSDHGQVVATIRMKKT